jgi:hypothetical protein
MSQSSGLLSAGRMEADETPPCSGSSFLTASSLAYRRAHAKYTLRGDSLDSQTGDNDSLSLPHVLGNPLTEVTNAGLSHVLVLFP